jgi:O-antigen ligase/tetratricopeptide (TPR) repeat protein
MTANSTANKKIVPIIFFILVCLSLLAPLWVFKDLLFPYVTSKAFYFRICIELALPFYLYLLIVRPELRPKWKKSPLNVLMVIFLILNLISALLGVSVIRSLFGNFERMGGVYYLGHLTLLYFYVLMIAEFGGSYLKRFLQMVLAVALIVTINGIFGKLGWPVLVMDPSLPTRVSSTLGNPIYLGSFLIVPLFLAIFLGIQEESIGKRITYYFSGFLFLVGILLSGTRGANVGLVGCLFFSALAYIVLTKNKKFKLYGSVLVVVFAIVCGALFAFNSKLPVNSDFRRLFTLKDSNTQARVIQWGVALKGYKDHPLFGVGPENYYVIGNLYYNPAIFQFDRSWFDKPHNYPLEILVTEGIFAFITYIAMMVFIVWAFYKGYKSGLYGLLEFCALFAGLLAYQIQNLTVFDTVPASLMFYCFMGFAGYLWVASINEDKKDKTQIKKKGHSSNEALGWAVFCVSAVVMGYLVYASNVLPMEAAKAVNYGYAYSSVDVEKADAYFQRAETLPFNFDKTETANRYASFASGLARTATADQQAEATKVLSESIDALNQALYVEPNYPITRQSLAIDYLLTGVQNGRLVSVNPQAEQAIDKAIALAPKREEAYLTLSQIKALEGDYSGAEKILNNMIAEFPTDTGAKLQLADTYRSENKIDQAATLTNEAVAEGYTFSSLSDMQWLVQYDYTNKDYDQLVFLLEQALTISPSDPNVLTTLAKAYVLDGQNQKAIEIAQQAMQTDSSTIPDMQAIINLAEQSTGTPPSLGK